MKILLILPTCLFTLFLAHILGINPTNAQNPYNRNNNDTDTQIIGFATTLLANKKPEGLLGNFIADAVKNEAEIYLRKRIDFVFISAKAIRGALNKGEVSVRMIQDLLPFDDSLAYLEVSGKELQSVLDRIAQEGGAPVSGVRMKIRNMRATNIVLDGDSLVPEKEYLLVTIERNAQGHENFSSLKHIPYKKLPNTLTSTVIRHIKKITSEGKALNAFFGHRISYD